MSCETPNSVGVKLNDCKPIKEDLDRSLHPQWPMYSTYKTNDVFLSFRGDDTRTNITSHLHTALGHKAIRTYIDDKLSKGKDVWPALASAIEDSHVAIVVFSENYASSRWCLEELVKILECRRQQGLVVIPVFYEVDPSDIRHLKGSYEKAFAKHERDPGGTNTESIKQKVQRWKDALTEAANISGWDSRIHKDESHVIKNVVDDVLQKLHLRHPTELKGLVGTEKICEKVELLLKKFRAIGIWGMGGIGKSTIAKYLFAKLFPQYDHVCFVANAKEYSPDKLFSELFKEQVFTSNVVGSTFHMRRLSSKKVFIVLDDIDMDSLNLLESLCREYGVLHRNSRLIITTRYRQLLVGRVDGIYEVKEWKNPESHKLFCLEAFNKEHPQKGYESLSERAVEYAGGVPLALKVLGSHFRKKKIEFWESTLKKLYMYPNENIQKVLEVSYTGLDDLEKKIFLDIAFFFKEKRKDHVIRILDACDFEATSGIEVLADKALITILKSNNFLNRKIQIQMHDLLQQMGLEIVRQECSADPGKLSRLKDNEAREVIEKNKGTEAIQGIALDLSQVKDLLLHANTFTKMKTLRILKFYNTLGQSSSNTYLDLPATLEPFSDQLRYIEWIGYPFESLPSPFCAKFLVEIHMRQSKVKQLWQGIQELDNLEGINLSECKQFEELPDLSKAPRLKWVILTGCESLQYLHPSVFSSETLVSLILDRCTNLKRVKSEQHLKSLEKISVKGCLSLEEFVVSSDLIENLDLSNTGIQTLDTSIGRMRNLKRLNLEGLRLRHPLSELSSWTSLMELKLSDSGHLIDQKQLHVLFDGLRSLLKLHMKDLSNLSELPDNISVLSKLYELRLDGSNVKRLPESIKNLTSLGILSMENCKELLCLPTLPSRIKSLVGINCTSLVSVSNLNPLATEMLGMTKSITFKNSLKLDQHSCKLIMKSLQLTMMYAVFDNVRSRHFALHGYNYTSVVLCLRGSSVPSQFKYQTTESSIAIELPKHPILLGLIYSVALSPAVGTKKVGSRIKCKCHLPEGNATETWLSSDIGGLNSDHVYVWYDPYHCDRILKNHEQKVCFEFCVANDEGEVDDSIRIKNCGVRLVSVSEVPFVLDVLDLNWYSEQGLVDLVKYVQRRTSTDSIVGTKSNSVIVVPCSAEEGTKSNSEIIEPDSTEEGAKSNSEIVEPDSAEDGKERKNLNSNVEESIKSTHNEIIGTKLNSEMIEAESGKEDTKSNSEMVEPDSAEEVSDSEMIEPNSDEEDNGRENHYSDVEESINSTHKETKTDSATDCRQNTRESKNAVKYEGNKGMPIKPDATLHETVASELDKENESKEKSITPSKLVVMVELENIKSTCKETQTTAKRGPKEKSTKSTQVVESKGNNGTQPESNAVLYEPVESQPVKENASADDSITEPKSMVIEAKSTEENNVSADYFSDVEEKIKSIHKETKTRANKESTTKSTKCAKSKENDGKPTESDVGLHLPKVSVNEANASKEDKSSELNCDWPDNNIEEAKHSEENENLQGGEIIVHSEIHDLNVVEDTNHENENENKGTELCCKAEDEDEDESDEDPFAELDSILLRSPKSSAKATDVAVREAMHNLNYLLDNSLEFILGDTELQQELNTALECIEEASQEKVSPNVAKLVEDMTSSIDDLFKDFAVTQKVVEDHSSCLQQKEKVVQQVRDAKRWQELVNKEVSQCKSETERLDKEAKRLDEKIRRFVEQKKSVELKKAKLKETLERCEGEKKKLKHEAKNKVTESKEIMLAIENSKSLV